MPAGKQPYREVLYEFRQVGHSVRVSALDAEAGTEVQIVGDSRYSRRTLQREALRKLHYVLAKQAGSGDPSEEP